MDSVVGGLRKMVNFGDTLVLLGLKQLLKLSAVSVHICEIQRSKIRIKWGVSQLVINVEEKGVCDVLRRSFISYPVQLI